jgi:hypothetical protein
VKKLLFPVKLGLFTALVLGALANAACGYHALYGSPSRFSWTVSAASPKAPNLGALDGALAGARAELSRAGALRPGTDYPRLIVELVRVDEVASGISAQGTSASVPLARASAVGVTARGWIEEQAGASPERDSGDVRRVESVSQNGEALASQVAFDDAARAAARLAGEAVARRVLGIVEPSVEPM